MCLRAAVGYNLLVLLHERISTRAYCCLQNTLHAALRLATGIKRSAPHIGAAASQSTSDPVRQRHG